MDSAGNYNNNLCNTHSPYCPISCRVQFLQKPMKKSPCQLYPTALKHSTLPCSICILIPTVLSFPGEHDNLQRKAEREKVLRDPTGKKEFIWQLTSSTDFLTVSPPLEKLPALPEFITKLKLQCCKRFNYTSDIQKGCDCII